MPDSVPATEQPALVAPAQQVPAAAPRSYWDNRAAARFDSFLFAAAATVLITRAFLAAAGYPQIGGASGLHIAHVLWGGLLLGVAMAIMMLSLGSAAKYWASVIGGVGFGLFIDEVGKFLTKDVNYFFRPAVAVIYGTLLVAYLLGREWSSRRRLDAARVRAIAGYAIADAELGQLSHTRRDNVRALLQSYPTGPAGAALAEVLDASAPRNRRSAEEWAVSTRDRLHRVFVAAARRRWVRVVVFTVLVLQTALSLLAIVLVAVLLPDVGPDVWADFSTSDLISLSGSIVQTWLMTYGLILLAFHRWRRGLRALRSGLFVSLMFTTVVEFGQEQFGALVSFAVVTVLLAIIGAAAEAERLGELGPAATPRQVSTTGGRPKSGRAHRNSADTPG